MANSPGRAPVDVGSVIADTYKIEALLGRGGMGAVFLASHLRLAGKQVAIKILHIEIENAEIVARFKREAEIAARLNHPNIVGVVDYNVAPDGTPYLVLDYLEGETLAQRIARGPLSLDQVTSILRQIGSALTAAHRAGIVHRDLKPQNIFLVPTEVDGRFVEIAKVLDFGISKIRGSQTVKTQDSALLGTPQYMAPEQATGQHASVDERTDVFALGAIVHEMLSGQPAFSGASIPEVVFKVVYEQPAPLGGEVPAAIAAAVSRAMAKPSDDRFPSVATFVEAVTGQPLTLSRGPAPAAPAAADSPSAARRVATGEAFARTMGSGDHGDSPIAGAAATAMGVGATAAVTPGPGAMRPHIPAPPSGSGVSSTGTAVSSTGAAVSSTGSASLRTEPGPGARRSRGFVVALALAGAAAAAAAAYVVTRGPSSSGHRPDVASIEHGGGGPAASPTAVAAATPPAAAAPSGAPAAAAAPPAAAPVASAGSPEQIADSGGAAKSAGGVGAKTTGTQIAEAAPAAAKPAGATPRPGAAKPAGAPAKPAAVSSDTALADASDAKAGDEHAAKGGHHTGSRPGARPALPAVAAALPDDTGGDEDARDKLKQASTALDNHDYDLAEKLANAVINSPATPRQRATARLIHGTVQCAARNDQEAAQIDLRNLAGFRALHTRLLSVCRSHGVIGPP